MNEEAKQLAADVRDSSIRTARRFKSRVVHNFDTYRNFTVAALLIVYFVYAWMTFKNASAATIFFGVLLGCLVMFNAWLQYDKTLNTKTTTADHD